MIKYEACYKLEPLVKKSAQIRDTNYNKIQLVLFVQSGSIKPAMEVKVLMLTGSYETVTVFGV